MGWRELVGATGRIVSLEHYGASADEATLYREFGITAEAVALAAEGSITDSRRLVRRPSHSTPPQHEQPGRNPMSERLKALADAGVSIWLDDLSRERIETGNLAELIKDSYVVGVTTNPTIFAERPLRRRAVRRPGA